MADENATQGNAPAVTQEPAPETPVVNQNAATPDSATGEPIGEPTEISTEPVGEPTEPTSDERSSKTVKELITQRKKRQEAEKEAAYWKGVAEGRGGNQEPQSHTPQKIQPDLTQPIPKPQLDDFPDWETWEKANDEWVIQEAQRRFKLDSVEKENRRAADNALNERRKRDETFKAVIEAEAEKDPTIMDIVMDETLPCPPHIYGLLQECDKPVELLKYLNEHRQEALQIAQIHPLLAAKRIGAIEAKLGQQTPPPPPKKVSAAPEPIKPVPASSPTTVDEDKLSTDEWMKRRNQSQYGRT